MTKRLLETSNVEVLRNLISRHHSTIDSLPDSEVELKKNLHALSPGCLVIKVKLASGMTEAIAMHKFQDSLSTMVAKENLSSLHLRYLTKEERENVQFQKP